MFVCFFVGLFFLFFFFLILFLFFAVFVVVATVFFLIFLFCFAYEPSFASVSERVCWYTYYGCFERGSKRFLAVTEADNN